ncbi:MAG: iron-containing alcohol dehydrogenase [Faecalicatena sp.]|uniref:iron-containing alcohol dehydrogenase n=1 Tax=Faecalicatena sp. TaxID=2005360 RepID=UPI0025826DFD|nr:iron-containing alcohol dehydrogenase [Faecalicatena sp.]MCI6465432.1 iron-containing alcohol dehydrogenase [Faecalicatena sp.]MDY5617264.1 iron-containing alcohol dehydrogenase [Lachnospiraceae bacterium]
MAHTFFMPGIILSGEDAAVEGLKYLPEGKAFIITAHSNMQLGLVEQFTKLMDHEKRSYSIFDSVDYEPTDKIVEEGVKQYQMGGCEYMIAIGGGSVLDVMKAVGLLVSCGGCISDYTGKRSISKALPFMAAIPTTAGTGSEATQFTIITNTRNDVKMLIGMPAMIPDLVMLIPEMTLTVPKNITVSTGMDALIHAVEAYISKKSQPLTDSFAISAVKRIFKNLPIVYEQGENKEARQEMAYAALEAGIAFSNSSVTLIHGMSRPIGALFHIPHGLSNAMLLNHCMEFMADSASKELGRLAEAVGLTEDKMSETEKAKCFLEGLAQLCTKCHVPTLAEYGIEKEEFLRMVDKMAEDALASGSPQNLRKCVEKEDIILLYHKLWESEQS